MVYTRDILVALLYVTLGAVVYEASKAFCSCKLYCWLFKKFSKVQSGHNIRCIAKYYLKNYKLQMINFDYRNAVDFEKYQNTMKAAI